MRIWIRQNSARRLLPKAFRLCPAIAISSDFIVGFPGETEEQFEDTYRLVEELRLDKAHIAKYSVRPKTLAARHLPDDVAPDEKERRRKRLDDLQTRILEEKNQALRGHAVEVLVEDIGFDGIREKVKKPLEGLKIAGYVGCQTNRPFGIAGSGGYVWAADQGRQKLMRFEAPETTSVFLPFVAKNLSP